MDKSFEIYSLPIGPVLIAQEDGFITEVAPYKNEIKSKGEKKETALTNKAFSQLKEYFNKERKIFDLPLNPTGTQFQKQVWHALSEIPYGETRSYKDIAVAIGNPKASRAVGMANNRNPISFIIPCHRVIGADGSLVGYGGGLDLKVKLLKLEGSL
ncbi:MAG: methylated-DNA--[protein]-cysteine S-methyltransferase [Sphaerochaetaceae bacterium]|jgi:methylated-DNA-[protein]-cysteine S-methyltransferase